MKCGTNRRTAVNSNGIDNLSPAPPCEYDKYVYLLNSYIVLHSTTIFNMILRIPQSAQLQKSEFKMYTADMVIILDVL